MNIARLQIVLDMAKTRQDIALLRSDLASLATTTNKSVASANQSISQIGKTAGQSAGQTKRAFSDMERSASSTLGRIGGYLAAAFAVNRLSDFVRESTRVSLEFRRMANVVTGLTGSATAAGEQIAFLAKESDRLGLNFRGTVQAFIRFQAAASGGPLGEGKLRDIFVKTAEAASKFGLTAAEQERIFLAYEQMVSKGVISMEELRRQLGDALPGAFSIGARAMGLTTRAFGELVETGQLLATDFLPKFADQLSKDVKGKVDELAVSIANMTNAWDRFKNSVGEFTRGQAMDVTGGLSAIIDKETAGLDALNLYRSIGGGSSTLQQQLDALRGRFPNANPPVPTTSSGLIPSSSPFTPPQLISRTSIDFISEFARMRREEPGFKEIKDAAFQRNVQPFIDQFGLPSYMTQQHGAGIQMDASQAKKFESELSRLTMERLDGREKIIESYEKERRAIVALGLPLDKEAQLVAMINENMQGAVDALTDSGADEFIEKMNSDAEVLDKLTRRIFISTLDDGQQKIARINDEFDEQRELLDELSGLGLDLGQAYEQLEAGRQRAISEVGKGVEKQKDRGPASFKDVIDSWGDLERRLTEGSGQLAYSLEGNFTDAFTSIIMGTKDVGAAFREMALSIIGDLVRISVQQVIVRGIMGAAGLAGAFGSAAGAGGAGGGFKGADPGFGPGANLVHSGGVAGGGFWRSHHRMHGGGVLGDEVPVVAKPGEVFFTPEQLTVLGEAMSKGGSKQAPVQIMNITDPQYFTSQLMRNKDVILNIIGREAKPVRRMLA